MADGLADDLRTGPRRPASGDPGSETYGQAQKKSAIDVTFRSRLTLLLESAHRVRFKPGRIAGSSPEVVRWQSSVRP